MKIGELEAIIFTTV